MAVSSFKRPDSAPTSLEEAQALSKQLGLPEILSFGGTAYGAGGYTQNSGEELVGVRHPQGAQYMSMSVWLKSMQGAWGDKYGDSDSLITGEGAPAGPRGARQADPPKLTFEEEKPEEQPMMQPQGEGGDWRSKYSATGYMNTGNSGARTPYGPAGQHAAPPNGFGGQYGFQGVNSAAFETGGIGDYNQSDNDFAPVEEEVEIQQQSQPAKPGMGNMSATGFGPSPAAPWQQG